MLIKKNTDLIIPLMLCLIFTCYFSFFCRYGDFWYYDLFFNEVSKSSLSEVEALQFNILNSKEPIYGLLVYVLSSVISKFFFDLFLNVILTYLIWESLRSLKEVGFKIILIFFNYYYLVLISSSERLKLAFIFILIIPLLKKGYCKYILFFLSLLSHLQMAMILPSFLYENFKKEKLKFISVIFLIFILLLGWHLKEQLITKLHFYYERVSFFNVWKPILIYILVLLNFRQYFKEITYYHIVLILFSLVLGTDRIVIFSILGMLYYFIKYKKFNITFYAVQVFLIVKSIGYLLSCYYFGDGFLSFWKLI